MSLSLEEVRKIAELARIELSPEEEKRHAETISAVLEYMKILGEVDTSAVESTYQVTGLTDITRTDEPKPSQIRDGLLGQMPEVILDELSVPAVFSEE